MKWEYSGIIRSWISGTDASSGTHRYSMTPQASLSPASPEGWLS
mgnify:CR=1 FL=1